MKFERHKDLKEILRIGMYSLANAIFKKMNQKSPKSWKKKIAPNHFIELWRHSSSREAALIHIDQLNKTFPELLEKYQEKTDPKEILTKYPNFLIYYDNKDLFNDINYAKNGLNNIEGWLDDINF